MTAGVTDDRRPSADPPGRTRGCTGAGLARRFGWKALRSRPREPCRSSGQPRADKRPRRMPAPLAKSPVGRLLGTTDFRPASHTPANHGQRHSDVPRLASSSPLPRFVAVNQVLRLTLSCGFVEVWPAARFPEPRPNNVRVFTRKANRPGDCQAAWHAPTTVQNWPKMIAAPSPAAV